jgi:uncharacterized membrane protein
MSKLKQVLLTFVGLACVYSGILALSSYVRTLAAPIQNNIMYSVMGGTAALGLVLVAVVVSEIIKEKSRK